MFDEDPAALAAIPEPMFRFQTFIAGVVLEITMKNFTQRFGFNEGFDRLEKRIVALHQIGNEDEMVPFRDGNHLVRLFDLQRKWLFADHMFARLERPEPLRAV